MSSILLGDTSSIAILDFGPFIDGSNKQDVADAMFASFRDTGFVYLVNHDLPKEKIEGMFQWVRSNLYSCKSGLMLHVKVQAILFATVGDKAAGSSPTIGNTSSRLALNPSFSQHAKKRKDGIHIFRILGSWSRKSLSACLWSLRAFQASSKGSRCERELWMWTRRSWRHAQHLVTRRRVAWL